MGNYWSATDDWLDENEGDGPACPKCGEPMFPADDHGRFTCTCNLAQCFDVTSMQTLYASHIPQVDTTGMSDEEKAKIPGINRLDAPPTSAETRLLRLLLQPDGLDDPSYQKAIGDLEAERGNNKTS